MKKLNLTLLIILVFLSIIGFVGCKAPEPPHEHTFSDSWSKDGTYHWHAATCEHTSIVSEKAKHTFSDWQVTKAATEEAEGSRERSCTVCGYKVTEAIEKLAHTHKFSEEWKNDTTYHWYACNCGEKQDVVEHSYTNGLCVCGMREMVLIPAGTFQMGSNAGADDNKPVHEVTITKPFYMGKYEVTQVEYEKYCSYTRSWYPDSQFGDGDDYPVYWVCWYDAIVYCNKRSIAEGLTPCYSILNSTNPDDWGIVPITLKNDDYLIWDAVVCNWNANGYRLPTEAEWEYAARAGDNKVDTLTWSGTSDVNDLDEYAWYGNNADNRIHEVGTKLPNAFGLYDMSGNISEWCWNWYTKVYNVTTEGGRDPTGVSSEGRRVHRGYSYGIRNANFCSVSYRISERPMDGNNTNGFRIVRSAN